MVHFIDFAVRRLCAFAVALPLLVSAQAAELSARLDAFIDALNAGDANAMFAFYEDGVTESFRNRRGEEEDRALYAMLTRDLGRLEIRRIERDPHDTVTLLAYSEKMDGPVTFEFTIEDERIDAMSVRPGNDTPGRGNLAVHLFRGMSDAEIAESLHAQLEAFADEDRFSGAVLLARDGEAFMHRAYGFADRAAKRPNTVATLFDVGSITKLITRAAVAQLLQAGRLDLEGKIIDYLTDYPNREVAARVTIRQLLDHSSGLGDIFNERWDAAPKDRYIAPRDFFTLFAEQPLAFEPGTSRAYSNAGFIVLGAIVESVSGKSFADYLEANIFEPAGMTRSGLVIRDGRNPALAVGYIADGPGGVLVDNLGQLPVKGCPAGSSMHTADDLLRFDRALRAGKLLDASWTAWLYRSNSVVHDASYAIGVAGGGPGVSAGLESSGDLTVIVLSNFDPPGGEALARDLFRLLDVDG